MLLDLYSYEVHLKLTMMIFKGNVIVQGFLNVLSIAFEESEFQSEIGQSQKQRWVEPSKGTVSRDGYFLMF